MNPTLQSVPLAAIAANPHRRIDVYQLNQRKLDALRQSIAQVGLWEGVIVRPVNNGYECAFGHHRLAAAREELGDDAEVTVVVRDLDDAQMLQFMGRENSEDYNTDFLVMLETWEAAVAFLGDRRPQNLDAVDIAGFLGWTTLRGEVGRESEQELTATAKACSAAAKLIKGGHLSRDDLRELSVYQAREVCQATVAHLETIERAARKKAKANPDEAPTPRQVERTKKEYAASAKSVAEDLREGRLGTKKARGEVWSRADIKVRTKGLPDFGIAVDQLARRIEGAYGEDIQAKLRELCDAAHLVPEDERHRYRHLAYVSDELSLRAAAGAKRARAAADASDPTPLHVVKGA